MDTCWESCCSPYSQDSSFVFRLLPGTRFAFGHEQGSGVCLYGRGKHFLRRNVAIGQEAERVDTRKMGMRIYGQRCLFMHESWEKERRLYAVMFVPAFC